MKTKENGVKYRGKSNGVNGQNGHTLQNGHSERNGKLAHKMQFKDEEFLLRESPLTNLLESSPHIRAIYHIFVVILVILFCDTLIYDLVNSGKINIGLTVIAHGFGNLGHALVIWMYMQLYTFAFYPVLLTYARMGKYTKQYPVLRPMLVYLGIVAMAVIETVFIIAPIKDLFKNPLGLASSLIVLCEMVRLMMKVMSVAVACGPRCFDEKATLPSFKHYVYFLFAPTLLYRDQYPRTKEIRWGKALLHLGEVAAIIFYNCFLWERFIMPYWSDYGKQSPVEAGTVIRGMFACILPGIIAFLSGFYCVLHAWLNAWAEILKFGDRLFYEEWWVSSRFSIFYRYWNRVVHSWLRDHIYYPVAPHVGRSFATFLVFFVSSVAHEVAIALSFGFFYPVLLVEFGVLGLIMVPLTSTVGFRYPNAFNFVMWLSFFFGNGLLWSLYPMEYFARLNCPPSEDDTFFVPKSWSCPEVILKPNWTFQNPLNYQFPRL